MWKIDHKCSVAGPVMDYASMKVEYNGTKLTRMVCVLCREEIYLVGHEPFEQAVAMGEAGFAILATRKAN